jgi:hypothetical protein
LTCAKIGRRQQDLGPLERRTLGDPSTERAGLLDATSAQWNVRVAVRDVDARVPRRVRGVARHIARTFAMADE